VADIASLLNTAEPGDPQAAEQSFNSSMTTCAVRPLTGCVPLRRQDQQADAEDWAGTGVARGKGAEAAGAPGGADGATVDDGQLILGCPSISVIR
jgi:hypothetical protein